MEVTDSQVHIWEAEDAGRPWPKGGYMPDWASTPLLAEDLLAKMDVAGVTRALLVPPAFNGGVNDYSLNAARRFPGRFGVVGRLNLGDPNAPEMMEKWAEEEYAFGLRFAFFLPEQKALLADGSTEWLWPLAQRLKIPLMIFPTHDLLGYFGNVAKKFDGLRLALDHLAVGHTERDIDDNAFPHIEQLINLAALPNVAVKASALPAYSSHSYPYRNIHGYLRQIIDAFGPERVFWGTDITRLTCTYRQALTMFTEEMPWLSRSDLALIMDKGVRDWHGWKVEGAK